VKQHLAADGEPSEEVYLSLPPEPRRELDERDATVIKLLRENRYDESTDTLELTPAQEYALQQMRRFWDKEFSEGDEHYGFLKDTIPTAEQRQDLADFFFWTAWAAGTDRPGMNYSYTNNWPSDPTVGNRASTEALVWSIGSIIALFAVLGIVVYVVHRHGFFYGESKAVEAAPGWARPCIWPRWSHGGNRPSSGCWSISSLARRWPSRSGACWARCWESKGTWGSSGSGSAASRLAESTSQCAPFPIKKIVPRTTIALAHAGRFWASIENPLIRYVLLILALPEAASLVAATAGASGASAGVCSSSSVWRLRARSCLQFQKISTAMPIDYKIPTPTIEPQIRLPNRMLLLNRFAAVKRNSFATAIATAIRDCGLGGLSHG
jgi:hypothetical protein